MRHPLKRTWESEEGAVIDTHLELAIVGSWFVLGGLMWWAGYRLVSWAFS